MFFSVKKTTLNPKKLRQLQARYLDLAARLGSFDSLSQGSVMPNPPNAWRWTRKVAGKTVSLGLTPAQAAQMKHAIANERELQKILAEMRQISQQIILQSPEISPLTIYSSSS